jgi:cytochrome c-type biogenesis protein CcmH/NrfF
LKRLAFPVILVLLAAASLSANLGVANAVLRQAKLSADEVAQGLTCQCGCGLTVANCNHPNCSFSVPVREQIEKMIAAGMTRRQILGLFRAKYGEKVLSAPDRHGFNMLAWIMPFAMLFIGALGILIALTRWRARQPAPLTIVREVARQHDARLRYRLRREVERLG